MTRRQLDRFKLSLAVVDVLGILVFFWTANWIILVYLALFNFLIILIDVVRRGMVVRPAEERVNLPDDLPIDPETGNMSLGGIEEKPQPAPIRKAEPAPTPRGVRNVPSSIPFQRRTENPFEGADAEPAAREPSKSALPKSEKHDPEREDIERTLEEWGAK